MKEICDHDLCTGCGACIAACPKKCISMERDSIGSFYPVIDTEECIDCNNCSKACHNNTKLTFLYPAKAYAGRSENRQMYLHAASGGIASSIYAYAADNSWYIMGTFFSREKGVYYRQILSTEDINWARDSKYVFSNMEDVYSNYLEATQKGQKAIFIGLPCQCSALKTFLNAHNAVGKLITAEIICHGAPPFALLDDHFRFIEKRTKKKIDKVSFRFPKSDYILTCYDMGGKKIYSRPMHWDDEYYEAFSKGLIFRNSCYKCRYARKERAADVTIGDYSGLGEKYEWEDEPRLSVILTNTPVGDEFINTLSDMKYLWIKERPVDEPLEAKGNPQLRDPSKPHKNRELFRSTYIETGDFEASVRLALKNEYELFRKRKLLIVTKRICRECLPDDLLQKIKRILKA